MSATATSDPRQVNINEIRSQLRAMWASQAASGETIIRASTHNLIVYLADHAEAEATTQKVIELTSDRPGRVILIDVEPGDEDRVEAWVTTYCRPAGKKQICGELITLSVQGDLRSEIHSTVISLLSPDLPVYLWWTCDVNQDDHLFQKLAKEADRVLVDTSLLGDAGEGIDIVAGMPHDFLVGDLNWARLTPWRQLVANLWDAASLKSALGEIRSLDVHYVASGEQKDSARALLLLGWMADALKWELVEAEIGATGGYITRWRKGDWQGKVELVQSKMAAVKEGEITNIYIQAGAKPPFVMPRLTIIPEAACIETRLNDAAPHGARFVRRFEAKSTSAALAEEIDSGYDATYRRAVARAAEILAACRSNKAEDS